MLESREGNESAIVSHTGDIYAGMRHLAEKDARRITFPEYLSFLLNPETAKNFSSKIFPDASAVYNIPADEIILLDERYNTYFENIEAAEQGYSVAKSLPFSGWDSVRKIARTDPKEAIQSGALLLTEDSYEWKIFSFQPEKVHGNPVLSFLFRDTTLLEQLLTKEKKNMDIMFRTPSHERNYLFVPEYNAPFIEPISCSPPSGDSGFNLKSYNSPHVGLIVGIV